MVSEQLKLIHTSNGADFKGYWNDVITRFTTFAEFRRKDHIFIADLPRSIFVQGDNFLTLQDSDKNFSRDILNPIKTFAGLVNTSYAATYGQWIQSTDSVYGGIIILPIIRLSCSDNGKFRC
jgi:hypothetical protein